MSTFNFNSKNENGFSKNSVDTVKTRLAAAIRSNMDSYYAVVTAL